MPSNKPQSQSSETSIQSVAIAKIRMDGGTQPRAQLFKEVVAEYAEDMRLGAKFPPVTVYFDGEEYWLADGFHRVRARESIGEKEVTSEVRLGQQRDAVLYAAGANASHGLRRTNADKYRSVERLLRDHEWRRWSNREIARRCGVSPNFVGNVRQDLSAHGSQTSGTDNEGTNIDPDKRIAIRGGTVFEMDTTNIRTRSRDQTEESLKRSRKKKKTTSPKTPRTQAKAVKKGDIWKLGKLHYLFCGDPSSSKFTNLFPSEVALALYFPKQLESYSPQQIKNWQPDLTIKAKSMLMFHSLYGDDIDLINLRLMLENCLATTTDADDPVVVVNIPDPLLFILMESVDCSCYCAEPDPSKCTEALDAWTAIHEPAKKLST